MRVIALDGYTRRGNVCRFTFRLEFDETLTTRDGEEYRTSNQWAFMRWDNSVWRDEGKRWSHDYFKPPREPTFDELHIALEGSDVEFKALRAIGVSVVSDKEKP